MVEPYDPVSAVEWLDAMSPWPRDGFGLDRMRALLGGARRSAGRLPGDSRRRDERQVDRDGHDRAAAPRRRAQHGRDDLASRRGVERANPHRRARGGLRGGHSARPLRRRKSSGQRSSRSVTAAALAAFAEAGVDVAVVEAGLGGRLRRDERAANARRAPHEIGLEHTDVLGDTLEAIATEKLAVARPDAIVVLPDDTYAHLVPERRRSRRATRGRRSVRGPRDRRRSARVASRPFRAPRRRDPGRRAQSRRCAPPGGSARRRRPHRRRLHPRRQGRRRDAAHRFVAQVDASSPRARRPLELFPPPTSRELARARFDHVEVVDDPVAAVARAHELGEPVLVTGSLYLLGDLAQAE